MLKNTLIAALIVTLPALAQEEAPQFPAAPAQKAPHWGARGEMPNRPQGDMHKRMLDKFDADKDGQLNEAEKNSMKAEMEKMRGQRGQRPEGFQPGKRDQRPEGFQPGMPGEGFEGAMPGNRRRPHNERPEMIKKFDADKDGQLSKEELEALKGAHGKDRAQGRPGRPGKRQRGERPQGMPMMPPAGAPEAPEAPEAPVAPAPQQ